MWQDILLLSILHCFHLFWVPNVLLFHFHLINTFSIGKSDYLIARKDALRLFLKIAWVWKFWNNTIICGFKLCQHDWKKAIEKPSRPGAISPLKPWITPNTSSSSNGLSNQASSSSDILENSKSFNYVFGENKMLEVLRDVNGLSLNLKPLSFVLCLSELLLFILLLVLLF